HAKPRPDGHPPGPERTPPVRAPHAGESSPHRGLGRTPDCPRAPRAPSVLRMETALGRFGRLGLWTADHRRMVALAWLTVAVGLAGLAPFADHALSGAGWVAVGSQSDREARLVDRYFPGQGSYSLFVVVRAEVGLRSPAGRETVARVRRVLDRSSAV